MLKNQNIICISSIDWDFIWQGHQEIMSTLAKNGNRVLFIENTGVRAPGIRDIARIRLRIQNWFRGVKGIRKEMENLYIFSPLVLPFPYARLATWVNRHLILFILQKWMKVMEFSDPIIWTFLPTPLSAGIIDSLIKRAVVYYCIDNLGASSAWAKKIRKSEINLLKKVDLIFVTSKGLYDYCSNYNSNVHFFPFGVNFQKFRNAVLEKDPCLDEFKGIKRPIIGYVGGFHKWIDQNLVREIAKGHGEHSLVFVGPVQTEAASLSNLKNVYFLGKKVHQSLPFIIKNFNVCIIPYLKNEYTENVYPTKLNEYLAMGKPVVSINLPEIVKFNKDYGNIVYVAEDSKGFNEYIDKAISENNQDLEKRRIRVAGENSWESRIEKMSVLIEKKIELKRIEQEAGWQENLNNFYKEAKRGILRIVAICLITYLLLFQTPILWFFAGPLKIEEPPRPADAIVVFAGGVGESGQAGQGYEERVQYAVELYKKGFAKKIIFSSGYVYAIKEAEVMNALAVSMGVPQGAILLEKQAKNTYENVKFTKAILDENNWDSVLLVSSPYHMRRAGLVFKRIGEKIEVISVPIPNSLFYEHQYRALSRQIKAIMHEYLGLVYYKFKGYI